MSTLDALRQSAYRLSFGKSGDVALFDYVEYWPWLFQRLISLSNIMYRSGDHLLHAIVCLTRLETELDIFSINLKRVVIVQVAAPHAV